MSILAPLSAKIMLGLGLALAASLGGNFLLVRSAWIKAGEAKGEAERAKLAQENAGFRQTAAINDALSKQAREDHTALVAELQGIARSTQGNKDRSRNVTRANPLPAVCVPGKARMDSVNKTLGPQ
jgi:hypothetical protein